MIIDGRKISKNILRKLKKQIVQMRKNGKILKLACVLVGDNFVSLSFIKRKEMSCREIGIDFKLFQFSKNINEKTLITKIIEIQKEKNLSGIVVQLPLPKRFDQIKILENINPLLDVDCLTPTNLGKLVTGRPLILPPTVSAILDIFKIYKIKLNKKYIVIVGRGDLVGKPLAILLTHKKCTIVSCNEYTKNLSKLTLMADILISCAGVPNLINGSMVKKGVIVIDVGTSFWQGKICGDVKFEEVKRKARLISPVPGGVGPVTVAKLLENVILLKQTRCLL